jgi:hypothetical protein
VDDWLTREAPLARAERYRKVAVQYSDFAGACISPFLRGFYRRMAQGQRRRRAIRCLRPFVNAGNDLPLPIFLPVHRSARVSAIQTVGERKQRTG